MIFGGEVNSNFSPNTRRKGSKPQTGLPMGKLAASFYWTRLPELPELAAYLLLPFGGAKIGAPEAFNPNSRHF